MHYRLRTLLILVALGPPVLAGVWAKHAAWKAERERKAQRLYWMISTTPPGGYDSLPKTVGELELLKTASYVGIDGMSKPKDKR